MEQLQLLQYAADVFERIGIPYAVVGSYGCMAFGEPRYTRDIDVLLSMEPAQVKALCAAFSVPEFYISEDAVRHAIDHHFQFNIIHNSTDNKIDCIFPRNDEWGRTQLQRREQISLNSGQLIYAASPEDIILGKLIYFSEGNSQKHLRDIKGILRITGSRINRRNIEEWAEKLGLLEDWNLLLMTPEEEA